MTEETQDALDSAINAATENTDAGTQEAAAVETPEAPAWEAPGWSKAWKEPSRQALEQLYKNETTRGLYESLRPELDGAYSYIGRLQNEYGTFRQRAQPIWNLVSQYEPQYRLQGMTLEQGVGQLFEIANRLQSDPDQTFPYLAESYKPRDGAAALRALADKWGVDVTGLVAETPYVDPEVLRLREDLQRMQAFQQSQLQNERQQLRNDVVRQLEAFESATDESGQPLYPHFSEVFELIPKVFAAGMANSLETAYHAAVKLHPELGKKLEAEAIERARKVALEEAKARSEKAEQAARASRNIGGKGGGSATSKRTTSLEDAIRSAMT